MNKAAVLTKIESATLELTAAEEDLERALREVRRAPRAEKTTISSGLQDAFAELRAVRAKLMELKKDLASEEPR